MAHTKSSKIGLSLYIVFGFATTLIYTILTLFLKIIAEGIGFIIERNGFEGMFFSALLILPIILFMLPTFIFIRLLQRHILGDTKLFNINPITHKFLPYIVAMLISYYLYLTQFSTMLSFLSNSTTSNIVWIMLIILTELFASLVLNAFLPIRR